MNLKLKFGWVTEISAAYRKAYSMRVEDNWMDLGLETMSEPDIEALVHVLEKHKGAPGVRAAEQKIKMYRGLHANVATVKITRLEALPLAVKEYMKASPNKFLFRESKDGYMLPWFVYNVDYRSPSRDEPARAQIHMAAVQRGVERTRTVTYGVPDIGDTVDKLLRLEGLHLETPELIAEMQAENEHYKAVCRLTGAQFSARGVGFDHLETGSASALETDEEGPAKVVMDDDEVGAAERRSERTSTAFWSDKRSTGPDDEENITFLPVHSYVEVFVLRLHKFLYVHASNLTPYRWDPSLAQKLVLPDEDRDLIETLVSCAQLRMEDIVKGKTGGIIVVCTGDAGTGKTLSAEVFSEYVQRPLYNVQCSQLGTDIDKLEENLNECLSRARRWKAIFLLDEADVYVKERGDDIIQNAIVGVFLRTLEYYPGIMFMTSNRATVIDDAILSRAIAWVQYTRPDAVRAAALWKILSSQYAVALTAEMIADLVTRFPALSGRSIKNMLRLARLRGMHKKTDVTVESLAHVAKFLPQRKETE